MYYGPVHAVLNGLATGFSPVKAIKVSSNSGKQTVLFDQEYPYALQSSPVEVDADTVIYESSPANAILRLTQMIELAQNAEWQRCGFFIQWREDGVSIPRTGGTSSDPPRSPRTSSSAATPSQRSRSTCELGSGPRSVSSSTPSWCRTTRTSPASRSRRCRWASALARGFDLDPARIEWQHPGDRERALDRAREPCHADHRDDTRPLPGV